MHIRTALFTYAMFVILLAVIGSALLFWYGSQIGKQAAVFDAMLQRAQVDEQSSQSYFRKLESEQQAGRAEYDPVQTVEMSYKVQQAKEKYETAMAQSQRIAPQAQELQARKERTLLWLIPLIAVGLLHVVLAAMFRPQRDELAASARRDTSNI